jgi:hypothetical protein
MIGYSGGGCYDGQCFHVGERSEEGLVSYTPAISDRRWGVDRIGVSGLAETDFADGVEQLLRSVQDFDFRHFRRWLRWTDDGLPDLQNSAKRRLNCERRRPLCFSRGFDENLLGFMSPRWPVALTFGEDSEEFGRHHNEVLAKRRAKQRGLEIAIAKYPEGSRLL